MVTLTRQGHLARRDGSGTEGSTETAAETFCLNKPFSSFVIDLKGIDDAKSVSSWSAGRDRAACESLPGGNA
jgi:hypothetical protein